MPRDKLQAYIETYMREHPEITWAMNAAELTQYIITVHDAVVNNETIIVNSPGVAALYRALPYRFYYDMRTNFVPPII